MIKYSKRICMLLTILMTMQIGTYNIYSDNDSKDSIRKDESVYVTLDNMGKHKDIIVSDWLHGTEGKGKVIDKTILRNITNINGFEVPEQNGEILVWRTQGKDIFYQGITNKPLPLRLYIKYYFDGKEVDPQSIAGRSGKFKMLLSIVNEEEHIVNIKGIKRKIYTPFSAAAVINLTADKFSNIKANAKVISDGSNQVITFLAFPGLKESFNMQKRLLNIQDTLEISADVKNFELGPIMITATPELPNLSILDSLDEAKNLVSGVNELKKGSGQLAKGSIQLSNGQKELTLNIGKLRYGIIQLNDGVKTLNKGAAVLDDGLRLAHRGSLEIHEGAVSVIENGEKIGKGASIVGKESAEFAEESISFTKDAISIMERIDYMTKDNPDVSRELKQSISRLKDKSIGLKISAEKINLESKLLNKFIDSFKKASARLVTASKGLVDGLKQLSSGSKELRVGSTTLKKGAGELNSGISKLEDGSKKLLDGSNKFNRNMDRFHNKGMDTFKLSLGNGIKDLEEALMIKDEIVKLSQNYGTFTGLGENMKGSVKFIMKTDEIKMTGTNKLKYNEARKKDEGFFKWLVGKYLKK